jgi:hypothetical protein
MTWDVFFFLDQPSGFDVPFFRPATSKRTSCVPILFGSIVAQRIDGGKMCGADCGGGSFGCGLE